MYITEIVQAVPELLSFKIGQFNPPMFKPFRLTYLEKEGGCHPPLEILTIACLTFCLLLTDRPTLGLAEFKLKVVNICKMQGTRGFEVVVLCAFSPISTICAHYEKSDEKVL